jgi:hypothetical protein
VDDDRNTSLLMWKTLRNSINEIQKIPPKKIFNPKDKNTIIKIKGSGPGSLTANRNENKNDTNPAGST